MQRRMTGLLVILGFLAFGQPASVGAEARPTGSSIGRVAIVGASLSQGFGAPPGWKAAVVASRREPLENPIEHTSLFFFVRPVAHGTALVSKTEVLKPSLVVALDFLFWFGYGNVDAAGAPMTSENDRFTLLDRGTALLEQFDCPVVIGDFPDMSAAVGRILAPGQVPQPATLAALNQRLRTWASSRTTIVLVSLAQWMDRIQAGQPIRIGEHVFDNDSTAKWLQEDRLHPSPEGLVALAMLVNERLIDRGFLDPDATVNSLPEIARKMEIATLPETPTQGDDNRQER
ncbi:MAG: hypothetical protein KF833_03735 [Verrucomicrobiae bacterium]|nr:hypothetical protein [Verrucomicrobiae bacterium]